MKVTTEELPERRVLLQIEVDPERLEKAMDQAYRRVVTHARIPGFRPGKAPRMMVERYLGRETLLHEALDRLVPEVYKEALDQEGIEAVAEPDFEFPQLEPVVLKVTVPLRPKIDLGDYRSIRVEPEAITVSDQDVESELEHLRGHFATVEPVQRPVQAGDFIRADIRGTVDGETMVDAKDAEIRVNPETLAGLPGLADNLIGAERGATKEFSVEVPENAEGEDKLFAGKTIEYAVRIHEVKEESLPDLNDEFAKQAGEGFANLGALRDRLRSDLQTRRETEAKEQYQGKVLDALVGGATVEYPPVLLDHEIDALIRERFPDANQRPALQRYLSMLNKSEEELRDEFRPAASERLVRSLVLGQFTETEGTKVGPEEIDAELERMTAGGGASADQIREIFGGDAGRRVLERSLLSRKSYDRLADIAMGRAPEPIIEATAQQSSAEEPTGSEAENTTETQTSADDSEAEAGQQQSGAESSAAVTESS